MQQEQKLQMQQSQQTQLQKYPNIPHFSWPTSKPGPQTTLPPPGQKLMPGRTDQVVEIGYNQETGVPGNDSPLRSLPDASLTGPTSFDQQETAQRAMQKRKKK